MGKITRNLALNKWDYYNIVAACLCLLGIGGWGVSHYMQTSVGEKYYTTNMEEVFSIYEGVLLAENISYEDTTDTNILLCYTGTDLPIRADNWKTLSVSTNYEDYDMTLYSRKVYFGK